MKLLSMALLLALAACGGRLSPDEGGAAPPSRRAETVEDYLACPGPDASAPASGDACGVEGLFCCVPPPDPFAPAPCEKACTCRNGAFQCD